MAGTIYFGHYTIPEPYYPYYESYFIILNNMNFEASKTERGFDAIHQNRYMYRKQRDLKKNGFAFMPTRKNAKGEEHLLKLFSL